MLKIDRLLIKVKFVTWVPADIRLARKGEIAPNTKIEAETYLWAPVPIGDDGNVDASKMPPVEQGALWAMIQVGKAKRIKGVWGQEGITREYEVLAVTTAEQAGPLESWIENQPGVSKEDEKATTAVKGTGAIAVVSR